MTDYKNKCFYGDHEYIPSNEIDIIYDENGKPIDHAFKCLNCIELEHLKEEEELREEELKQWQEQKKFQHMTGTEAAAALFNMKPNKSEIINFDLNDKTAIDIFSIMFQEDTNNPKDHCEAFVKYLISIALGKIYYANNMGIVDPILPYIWIDESGSNKSGFTKIMRSIKSEAFPDIPVFERVSGGTAVTGAIGRLGKTVPKVQTFWIWDEIQDLISTTKNEATSDILTAVNQIVDGYVQSKTITERGNKISDMGAVVHCPIWFTGTPELYEGITKKGIWTSGSLGERFLHLRYIGGIKENDIDVLDKNIQTTEKRYDKLIQYLQNVRKLYKVETTNEFMIEYNKYRKQIANEITNVGVNLENPNWILKPEIFSIKSKVKYQLIVIQLAIIHATSRGSVDGTTLIVDLSDLKKAIQDLNYHHEQKIFWFER